MGIPNTPSSSAKASQSLSNNPENHNGLLAAINSLLDFTTSQPAAGLDFDPEYHADDEMWRKYVERKGSHLLCLMKATDERAGLLQGNKRNPPSASSEWSGNLKEELATWFWHPTDFDKRGDCDWEQIGLKNAFNSLDLNAKPAFESNGDPADGNNECFTITHYNKQDFIDADSQWPQMKNVNLQKYTVGDKEYKATGAYYQFVMNKVDGAIIGKELSSPENSVTEAANWNRKAAPEELPRLRFCSDIYWAHWVRDNANVKNIRVYGVYHVVNNTTVLLISRAFKNKGVKALKPWPGTSFSVDTDEGKALIGSPMGATIAHMLIQHKLELGIKYISRVTVVANESKFGGDSVGPPIRDMHMFFEIEDVPVDEITSEIIEG